MAWLQRIREATYGRSWRGLASNLFGHRHRRVHVRENCRVHVELRNLEGEVFELFADELGTSLQRLDGIAFYHLNGQLGRLVVGYRSDERSPDELVRLVEGLEVYCGLEDVPFSDDPLEHPGDVEPILRKCVQIAADAVGAGTGAVLACCEYEASRLGFDLAALLSWIEETPHLREYLERYLGEPAVDVGVGSVSALIQAVGSGPFGPLVDLVLQSVKLRGESARCRAWDDLEHEWFEESESKRLDPIEPGGRPVALPQGPIERYVDEAWYASIGGFLVGVADTHQLEASTPPLFSGFPKAARYGRLAYVSECMRTWSARDVAVLRPEALHCMDRVDVVVIEADELFSGDYLVERIHPVQGAEFDEIHPRVTSLFDLDDPETRRVEGHWMLGTLSTLDVVVDETTRCRVERLGETGGPVLLLTCEGEVRAFVETRPRLDPEAERLVHSAKRADLECLVAVSDARRRAVPETFGIVEREALIRELRSLQLQRRCVALVADADRSDALAAADLGIGLRRSGENPPWRADLVVDGPLERAGEVLEACGLARDVARQSVSLAEIGATMGVFLSLQGLESTNPGHVKLAVNTVALVALANGVRKVFELEGREPPPRRESTPWHALAVEEVLERLDTDRTGLSPEQVQARYEPPVPEPSNASQWGRAMGRELSNPLTPVLGAAAAVSAIVGSTGDAGLVTAVVLFNAAISGTERFRAEQALDALADSHVPEVRVRRRGRWRDLEADALVPGDVLHLEAGDIVPADCRIASARDLEVDESSLTGESVPVEKSADRTFAAALADRHSMVYAGTSIAGGEAEVVAVAVGSQTEARRGLDGRPLHHPETGIQARLRALTDVTVPAAGMAGVLLLVAGLVRQQDISRLADTGVGMAVAAVPEGLPLLATVAERATARRLSERDVLVRNPRSLEALARVDILCADKTGTLTEGRLELHRLDDGDRTVRLDGTLEAWQRRLLAIARRATPEARGADERQLPHPTDRAVVEGARRFGVDGEEDVGPFERLKTLPFQPRRGYCAVQIETSSGSRRLAMKGAPEVVLNKCDRRATDDGVEPLSPSERRRLEDRAERMAATGLRTLAVAERRADTPVDDWDEATTERMVFHGLLGLRDPPRPEARRAIERLREAGVEVLMITGDHRRTAEHVADELDLEADSVLTGPDLDRLDDDDLAEALSETSVIARTSPTQKGRIVEALQADDKVVAMTGDGANDAPAIRLAEVGMALGEKSTRATRDAADLVLADERLEAIVRAIGESRAMMEAVRDATSILTGGNFGEIGFTVLASLLSQEAPLNARQLLLVNLLTDVAPSMSIAVRTPTDDDLEAHLAGEMDGWLDAGLEHDIALRAVTTMGGATSAWGLSKGLGCDPARSSTVALLSLVGTQLAQTIAVDHPTRETLAAGLGSAMVLFGTVMTPGIGRFFRSRPVGPVGLAIAAGASTATTATSWLGRRLYRRWREWRDD